MDIPLDPSTSPHYLVLFDDGTSTSVTASKMPSLIPKLEVNVSNTSHLLPPFLRKNSKITFDHDGKFHKGYLTQLDNGTYDFSYKSHINKKHAEWSVPLPNLTSTWHDLCINGTLLRVTQQAHSFGTLWPTSSAPLICFESVLVPSFLLLMHHTWIETSGSQAFGRRRMVLSQWTHMILSPWRNTGRFAKKEHPKRFLRCASSP